MSNVFVILEPEAKDSGGHFLNVAIGLQEYFKSTGNGSLIVAHKKLEIELDQVFRFFRIGYWRNNYYENAHKIFLNSKILQVKNPRMRKPTLNGKIRKKALIYWYFIFKLRAHIKNIFSRFFLYPFKIMGYGIDIVVPFLKMYDLNRAIKKLTSLYPSIVDANFVLTTVNTNEVFAIKYLTKKYPQMKFHLFIRAIFSEPLTEEATNAFFKDFPKSKLGKALVKITDSILTGKVYLYTDTMQLKFFLEKASGIKFNFTGVPTLEMEESKKDNSELTITYLGDSRSEKGFTHLPAIVDALKNKEDLHTNFIFQVSGLSKSGAEGQATIRLLEDLKQNLGNRIELRKGNLDSQDYKDILLRSHINLLPYEPDNYIRRSSGIFFENLLFESVPCVPTGTTMSTVVYQSYGAWLSNKNLLPPKNSWENLVTSLTSQYKYTNKESYGCAIYISYYSNSGAALVVKIEDEETGTQIKHILRHENPYSEGNFAVPVNPDFQNFTVTFYSVQNREIIRLSSTIVLHSHEVSFWGFTFDSLQQLPTNIEFLSKNYESSLEAIKVCKNQLKELNTFSHCGSVLLENSFADLI